MSPQKFVVRLLDAAGTLLAWATVYATAKPQARPAASCPFMAPSNTTFVIEQDGLASQISVHWCELDVARKQNLMEPVPVQALQVFTFAWIEPVWLVAGTRDVPLPQVTVRAPVKIGVPTGALGVVAPA
jgi:hypothetical protein